VTPNITKQFRDYSTLIGRNSGKIRNTQEKDKVKRNEVLLKILGKIKKRRMLDIIYDEDFCRIKFYKGREKCENYKIIITQFNIIT